MSSTKNAQHADIIVVGAGVLGTFHAYFAAQKGYSVLLLDRNTEPSEASTRNFGMQVQTIVETDNDWTRYVLDSREIYRSIQQETDISLRQNGALYLSSTEVERTVLQEFAQTFGESYHCTFLEPREAIRRFPFANAEYCSGALFFSEDCAIEPHVLVKRIIAYATRTERIEYRPQTTVIDVSSSAQGCVVKDTRGNIYTADQVIICNGTQYQLLFPELFAASGLKVCKLQMMRTVPQPQILPHSILSGLSIKRYPAFASCPSYAQLEAQPTNPAFTKYGIHLLLKQASDGTVIIGDSHEYFAFDEITRDIEYTHLHINDMMLNHAQTLVNLPTWEIQNTWIGCYMIHPERPVYTHSIDANIHIATGIGGKGMSTGPGFSRAHIAEILS